MRRDAPSNIRPHAEVRGVSDILQAAGIGFVPTDSLGVIRRSIVSNDNFHQSLQFVRLRKQSRQDIWEVFCPVVDGQANRQQRAFRRLLRGV
jgi:hypothetical protein